MEAFVLCAGMGSRLRPLTDSCPKALVEVGGKPLVQIAIEKLYRAGVHHIVVNVHHLADQLVDYLRSHRWEADIDISDERAQLLDTGGALRKAASLFSGKEAVLVHNVDILSDIDFAALADFHRHRANLVSLCASERSSARRLMFDADGRLAGREGEVGGDGLRPLAFSGVSLVEPTLFSLLPQTDEPFPIIPCYIALSPSHPIRCFQHSADRWLDVGKPSTLQQARQCNRFYTK